MAIIKVKGFDIRVPVIRDSYNRRTVQYANSIIETLRKIGITEDDISIKQEMSGFRSAPASVSWYVDGYHLYYSYKLAQKHVENLYVVLTVIELEVKAVLAGQKTMEEFIKEFTEGHDVEEQRQEARLPLGIGPEVVDTAVIDAAYKDLAKNNHPDMPGGDTEKFKAINRAHKILKRELR